MHLRGAHIEMDFKWKTKTRQNKTYIEDDCHLAEASQEVVPYTCRKVEQLLSGGGKSWLNK